MGGPGNLSSSQPLRCPYNLTGLSYHFKSLLSMIAMYPLLHFVGVQQIYFSKYDKYTYKNSLIPVYKGFFNRFTPSKDSAGISAFSINAPSPLLDDKSPKVQYNKIRRGLASPKRIPRFWTVPAGRKDVFQYAHTSHQPPPNAGGFHRLLFRTAGPAGPDLYLGRGRTIYERVQRENLPGPGIPAGTGG